MMEDLDVVRLRLRNWARWATDHPLPNLDAKISAIYALAASRLTGWGDPGDDVPPPIYEQDAELMDAAIRSLALQYRTAILRQYIHYYAVDRLLADASVRALLDHLQSAKMGGNLPAGTVRP